MGDVSKNLNSYEILPPDYKHLNWRYFIDGRMPVIFQFLRDKFGRIDINTYKFGGASKYRGYRPPDCKVGAKYSQHRFGRALDLCFVDVTCTEVYDWILKNQEEMYKLGLRRMENAYKTKTWLHIDAMEHGQNNTIQTFNP
jgi:hypothetical protein